MRSEAGVLFPLENNILKQQWQEKEKWVKSEECMIFKTGQADFKRFWNKQMDNKWVAYYRKDFV